MADDTRYTAKVAESSEITDFLKHAKEKLTSNIADARRIARPIYQTQGLPLNELLGKVAAPATQVVPSDKPGQPQPQVQPSAQSAGQAQTPPQPLQFSPGAPAEVTSDADALPKFDLSVAPLPKSELKTLAPVTPIATKHNLSAALPEVEETVDFENDVKFSPAVTEIKTDVLQEAIPDFSPDVYNPKVTVFPPNPEPPTLVNVLTVHFGTDWVNWEPETLRKELVDRGLVIEKDMDLPQNRILFDMLFAAQLLYSHSGFMDFWRMFEKVCKALNGKPVIMQEIQNTTPFEMSYFRKLVNILREDLKNEDFGTEVLQYQAACCFNAGFYVAPKILKSCQPHLDKLLAIPEKDNLKQNLWDLEDKLYNMDVQKFNSTLETMQFTEAPSSIQLARHLATIRYVRERVDRIKAQLNLGS